MTSARRINLLTVASLLAIGALGTRLYALTVTHHGDMRRKAEERRRHAELLPARRGMITARNGEPLAVDRSTHRIGLDLPALDPALEIVTPLAACLRIERTEALTMLRSARAWPASDDGEIVLAKVPLEDAERTHRILRRKRYVWARVEWDGVCIVTRRDVLDVRDEGIARLADLLGQDPVGLSERVKDRVDAIHALPADTPETARTKRLMTAREKRIHAWREPLVIVDAAPIPLVMRVTERSFELPGLVVEQAYTRTYPHGAMAVHAIGYMGQPSAAEVRRDREQGLLLDGDRGYLGILHGERKTLAPETRLRSEQYGRTGIERTFDTELRGTPGVRVVIRDVKNRVREELSNLLPRDGHEVRLALNLDVQQAAEKALDGAIGRHGDASAGGAAVMIDLSDGGILAMASGPRYDANRLGEKNYYKGRLDDRRRPLFHRAVQAYAPGSTMKILSAFAMFDAEQEGAVELGWTTNCQGRLSRKIKRFHCDGVHWETGLVKAVCKSCNVYFFRAADRIGLGPLDAWAKKVGFGQPMAEDVFGERGGFVPFPGFKRVRADKAKRTTVMWSVRLAEAMQDPTRLAELQKARGRTLRSVWWQQVCEADASEGPGDVRNAIIGQGAVLLTPLQVASLAAMIATGGRYPLPKLRLDGPTRYREVDLDPAVLEEVREGMRGVVERGTASSRAIGLRDFDVAGKTGTAERNKDQPHLAWFMGYYPASNPEVAFAVLVDRTRGHGGGVCGPVARQMLEAYEVSRGGELR